DCHWPTPACSCPAPPACTPGPSSPSTCTRRFNEQRTRVDQHRGAGRRRRPVRRGRAGHRWRCSHRGRRPRLRRRPGRRPGRGHRRRDAPTGRRRRRRRATSPGGRHGVARPGRCRPFDRPDHRGAGSGLRDDPPAEADQPAAPRRHQPTRCQRRRSGPARRRYQQGGQLMAPNHMPRDRRLPRVLWGVGSTTAYAIGIPILLIRAAGWPLPRRVPPLDALWAAASGAWRPDDQFIIAALAVIAWAGWAQISAVTVGVLRFIRSGRAPYRVPGSASCRPIAFRLAAALAAFLPFVPRAAGAAPLPAHTAAVHASTQASCVIGTSSLAASAPTAPTSLEQVSSNRVHVVRPAETLWDIARAELGDPRRWRELFELNRGRLQSDGRRLEDSELLRPGWRIEVPGPVEARSPQAVAATTAAARTATASPEPGGLAQPETPLGPTTALAQPQTTSAPAPASSPMAPAETATVPMSPTAPGANAPIPAPDPPTTAPFAERAATPEPAGQTTPTETAPAPMTVGLIGLPSLTGGALIGYLGGLRRERERRRRRHHRFSAPIRAQQDAERQVRAVARLDAPRWVDLALRHLAAALQEDGAPPPPTILAVRAGNAGLDVFISPPWPVAPGRFIVRDDGHTWRLDPAVGLEELARLAAGVPAYVPGVVTVGETNDGAVLVDLDAAGSLTIEGFPERAETILTAMTAELATAPWSEHCDICLIGAALELQGLERVRTVPAEDAVAELASTARRSGEG